jgi:PIN domain nuclease of toxin-antitoxin system
MRPQKGTLLDTHVLLWALKGTSDLSSRVVRLLESAAPLYFSPVSIMEIVIKTKAGKLPPLPGLIDVMESAGFRSLPLDTASALEVTRFAELEGTDPFDRALLAQALTHSLYFETVDRRLLSLDIADVRDARH